MNLSSRWAICLLLLAPLVSRGMTVTPSPDGLVESFVTAWNFHNSVSFGHLMAADADWVTASGVRLKGRDKIQAFLAEEHATWAKTTTMKKVTSHVRMLDEKTAIVMFEWEITTPGEVGAAPTTSRGNNLFVAIRDGDWLIAAGQVARVRPR